MDCNHVCIGIQQFVANAFNNLFMAILYLAGVALVIYLLAKLFGGLAQIARRIASVPPLS